MAWCAQCTLHDSKKSGRRAAGVGWALGGRRSGAELMALFVLKGVAEGYVTDR